MKKNILNLFFIFIVIFFVFDLCLPVFAEESDERDIFEEQLESLDFGDVNRIFQNNAYTSDFNVEKAAEKFISGEGELSFKMILDELFQIVFKELKENTYLIRNVIIVCILSAVLKNLTASFKSKETGELGFYISYIVMVIILFSSFSLCINILNDTAGLISELMKAVMPLMVSLLIMSGNSASAYLFHPVILFAAEFIITLINNLAVPLITVSAVMQIVNYLSHRELLTKFSELIKQCVEWGIKGCAVLFIGLLSLQRLGGGVLNGTLNKTAKFAVNMVPVVGDVLSGTVDTVMTWTMALKSSVGAAVIVGIIILCTVPIIKLVCMIFVYKFTAAVIQPVCDKRITECIDSVGQYTIVILSAVFTVMVMFIFSVIIMISVSGV